jgi:DNA-binding MarR family transcriptional regulator
MDTPDTIEAVRRFNRFYTRAIGVLRSGHLGTAYSLAETRVLYEIARVQWVSPEAIMDETGLDRSSLSRITARLESDGLIARNPAQDADTFFLTLTAAGTAFFRVLQARTITQLEKLLSGLSRDQRTRLASRFHEIETLLGAKAAGPITLRPPRIGDIGWVVQRHGILYAREYGWDERFEALCARIVGEFFATFDPAASGDGSRNAAAKMSVAYSCRKARRTRQNSDCCSSTLRPVAMASAAA